jgi:hypothetical protein
MATYFGTLTGFTLPYTNISSDTLPGGGQSYGENLDFISGSIEDLKGGVLPQKMGTHKKFTFMAIGTSRLTELKKYGLTGYTQNLDTGSLYSGSYFTGYTLNSLYYMDFPTNYTMITGSIPNYFSSGSIAFQNPNYVTGNTTEFATEFIINNMLTRNEHFLGFIEQPRVYSDVFVERGKQGVMEMNFRLGEIDNMGELSVYGNGFFNVKKQ